MPLSRSLPRRRRALDLPARALAGLFAVAALAGCSSFESLNLVNVFAPYRVEVVQGNVVTQEQAARVVPGMTRTQVRDLLGSPLLTDLFHADRWDYVFTLYRQGQPLQRRAVAVFFEGDILKRIDAADLPSESEFITSIDPYRSRREVPTLALTEEQIKALPLPPRVAPAASAPEGANRSYPPLEPRG